MPCKFTNIPLMLIHTALLAQFMKKFANGLDYILAGDFNSTPDSPMYELLTRGRVADAAHLPPPEFKGDYWEAKVAPLWSAYRALLGKEPTYTNFAEKKGKDGAPPLPPLALCLDYIFYSNRAWKVTGCKGLPRSTEGQRPGPNEAEMSDHLLIAASFAVPVPAVD